MRLQARMNEKREGKKVRLGTSTNLLCFRPDGRREILTRTLELVSIAGFRVFDLNFYDWSLPGSEFLTEKWELWIDAVAEKAAELGVEFGQCHGYFYNFLDPAMSEADRGRHEQLQLRSLACCEILGAHTCVLHPETDDCRIDYVKPSFAANREFYDRILEWLSGGTMRVALENMCDFGIAPKRKFCAYPEELVDFVESFCSDRIGICWDFEHGDIMGQDQEAALLHIGKHLLATHVSDTYSRTDNKLMHVLPMTGTVDWHQVMHALRKIGYNGDFCYEVHNYTNHLPDEVIPTALKLAYEIGVHLMNL